MGQQSNMFCCRNSILLCSFCRGFLYLLLELGLWHVLMLLLHAASCRLNWRSRTTLLLCHSSPVCPNDEFKFPFVVVVRASTCAAHCCRLHDPISCSRRNRTTSFYCEFVDSTAR